MPLYHNEVGFPPGFVEPSGYRKLSYSDHAIREAEKDRFGSLLEDLPAVLVFGKARLVEVEIENGVPTKYLYRLPLQRRRVLVMAVAPEERGWRVKTVWSNNVDDVHGTLDRSKYHRPATELCVAMV